MLSPVRCLGLSLALVASYFVFHPFPARGESFKSQITRLFQDSGKNSSPSEIMQKFQRRFPSLYYLPLTNTVLHDHELAYYSSNTNRLSLALFTNSTIRMFFIRPDTYKTDSKCLQSSAPIIVVSDGKMADVFDMSEIVDELTQEGYFFFHGFTLTTNEIPSIIASAGPVGSGNYMWFYRFDFIRQRDGHVKPLSHLLVDAAHVVDFSFDSKRANLSVIYYGDKWRPETRTTNVVSLR